MLCKRSVLHTDEDRGVVHVILISKTAVSFEIAESVVFL